MGCGGSREENKVSDEIDRKLFEEKKAFDNEVKILLLGAGESGKSTVAKQIKIIHMNGFTVDELSGYKLSIYNNLVICMRALVKAAGDLGFEIQETEAAERLRRPENELLHGPLTTKLAADIKALWEDPAIKQAYDHQCEFQLYDCAAYLFDNIDRISQEHYIPSVQDVLVTRVKTTGVSEIEFMVNDTKFKFVDVGGQRNERRKWMHCFQDVTAVLFVVALSEYNLKLYEDGTTNRMFESLKLFKEMCNNQWFINTAMIIFLNKSDLFAQKIPKYPLSETFPEYTGGADFDKAVKFIADKFESQNTNPNKPMYFHVTCATDTKKIEVVLDIVKDVIFRNILHGLNSTSGV